MCCCFHQFGGLHTLSPVSTLLSQWDHSNPIPNILLGPHWEKAFWGKLVYPYELNRQQLYQNQAVGQGYSARGYDAVKQIFSPYSLFFTPSLGYYHSPTRKTITTSDCAVCISICSFIMIVGDEPLLFNSVILSLEHHSDVTYVTTILNIQIIWTLTNVTTELLKPTNKKLGSSTWITWMWFWFFCISFTFPDLRCAHDNDFFV